MKTTTKTGFNIGSLFVKGTAFLAPMAGFANLPFRRLCRELGCDFVTTEMVSAEGLVRCGAGSEKLLADHPLDRPRAVQLFGADPGSMARAALLIQERDLADVLDINMGCPVRKVVSSGAGSALLKVPQKAIRIVEAVKKAVDLPITVKLRAGWDQSNICAVELGLRLEQAGADALFLHPRTKAQGFSGRADWSLVADLVDAVSIPVIGGGDVRSPGQALSHMLETGCAGVQVGRAALGNPGIFSKWPKVSVNQSGTWIPSPDERLSAFERHLQLYIEYAGEKKAALELRKHVPHYFRGIPGASRYKAAAQQAGSCDELLDLARKLLVPGT
ncbi:MAG: tRNA dihydrouridine synthase DusB [Deltaproteobacteria bacterium]|nr:tRNA dihydrouridine synthase DusB [Deltaproteobacteria bacterium]